MRRRRTGLYLIRHCSTAESALGRCIGRTDVPLSAAGRDCAESLAAGLAQAGLDFVYSSPLKRARDTAAPIAARVGGEIGIADGLVEIDFGSFEGRTFDQIATAHPDLYRRWMTTPTEVSFPGGESYADLKTRAVSALEEIAGRHPGAVLAVVSHGGPIRAILAGLLRLPDQEAFNLPVDHGAVTLVDGIAEKPRLRFLNLSARACLEFGTA